MSPNLPSPHGIEVNVVAHGPKIREILPIYGDGFVAALKQMASEAVFHVVTNRVG